jgi:hypothetical protein
MPRSFDDLEHPHGVPLLSVYGVDPEDVRFNTRYDKVDNIAM